MWPGVYRLKLFLRGQVVGTQLDGGCGWERVSIYDSSVNFSSDLFALCASHAFARCIKKPPKYETLHRHVIPPAWNRRCGSPNAFGDGLVHCRGHLW